MIEDMRELGLPRTALDSGGLGDDPVPPYLLRPPTRFQTGHHQGPDVRDGTRTPFALTLDPSDDQDSTAGVDDRRTWAAAKPGVRYP